MKKKWIIILGIIIVVIITFAILLSKNIFNSQPYINQKIFEMCRENYSNVDYQKECQNYLDENYLGRDCIADGHGSLEANSSCNACAISCIPEK
ncbi:MAG: hypothetical protein WC438_03935 [Candidatus Pacearchaeota archaeon]